jgi:predicted transcriptional regulator
MDFLEETRKRVKLSDEKLKDIAAGAGVSYNWLRQLKGRFLTNPRIRQVQSVYDYLEDVDGQP